MPRLQYNLWNSPDPSTAARDTPRAQQNQQGGLSLTLSSQQLGGFGSFRSDREIPSPAAATPNQGQAPAVSGEDIRVSGGSSSSVSGVTNGVSGIQSVLLSSKYLKAAQELLDEVVNVGNGIRTETPKKGTNSQQTKAAGESSAAASGDGSLAAAGDSSGKRVAELTPADRQEIQMKKAKLITMLDEVCSYKYIYIHIYIYIYSSSLNEK